MDNLSNIGVIKSLLTRHGFTFSKALGQNFLVNPSVCPRMAEQSGAAAGVGVIEIGAGIGVLTRELAARAQKVVCVEIDQRLLPILDETLADCDNVTIINEDVLKVDLHALIREQFGDMPVVVCANLPYYITSPVIMRLLESRIPVGAITVMVQKEAAVRICANPGTRQTGAIGIAVHYYSAPKQLFTVSRGSFMPSPDVDSSVIRLDVHKTPPVSVLDEKIFFDVVKGAFSQRRKVITNGLCAQFGWPKQQMAALLDTCGIDQKVRAEELSLIAFAAIADAIALQKNAKRPVEL